MSPSGARRHAETKAPRNTSPAPVRIDAVHLKRGRPDLAAVAPGEAPVRTQRHAGQARAELARHRLDRPAGIFVAGQRRGEFLGGDDRVDLAEVNRRYRAGPSRHRGRWSARPRGRTARPGSPPPYRGYPASASAPTSTHRVALRRPSSSGPDRGPTGPCAHPCARRPARRRIHSWHRRRFARRSRRCLRRQGCRVTTSRAHRRRSYQYTGRSSRAASRSRGPSRSARRASEQNAEPSACCPWWETQPRRSASRCCSARTRQRRTAGCPGLELKTGSAPARC